MCVCNYKRKDECDEANQGSIKVQYVCLKDTIRLGDSGYRFLALTPFNKSRLFISLPKLLLGIAARAPMLVRSRFVDTIRSPARRLLTIRLTENSDYGKLVMRRFTDFMGANKLIIVLLCRIGRVVNEHPIGKQSTILVMCKYTEVEYYE